MITFFLPSLQIQYPNGAMCIISSLVFYSLYGNQIAWTEHMSNEEVLKKMSTKKTVIFKIRRKHLKFLEHMRMKGG